MRPPHITGPALPCPAARWGPAARGGFSLGGDEATSANLHFPAPPLGQAKVPPRALWQPQPHPRRSEHSNQAPADPRGKAKEPPRAKHRPHTHRGHRQHPSGIALWNSSSWLVLVPRTSPHWAAGLGGAGGAAGGEAEPWGRGGSGKRLPRGAPVPGIRE